MQIREFLLLSSFDYLYECVIYYSHYMYYLKKKGYVLFENNELITNTAIFLEGMF